MAKAGTKSVVVEIPELADLALEQGAATQLDSLCSAARSIQAQIAPLTKTKEAVMADLKPLAEALALPERVLGSGWDLRRSERVTEKLNVDRLKMTLLQGGWTLDQANALVEQCTDRTESVSWSVYGREQQTPLPASSL